MSNVFPTGEWYIVDRIEDVRGIGRRLHFVLPDGRAQWVSIGNEADTETLRDNIASHLRDRSLYVKDARIG